MPNTRKLKLSLDLRAIGSDGKKIIDRGIIEAKIIRNKGFWQILTLNFIEMKRLEAEIGPGLRESENIISSSLVKISEILAKISQL